MYKNHTVRAHSFFKFELSDSSIGIGDFDNEWLEQMLKVDPGFIASEKIDNMTVLTASTEFLQEFVCTYEAEVFKELKHFKRLD